MGKKQKTKAAEKPAKKAVPEKKNDSLSENETDDIPVNKDYSYLKNITVSIDKEKYFERPISSKEEIDEIRNKMQEEVEKVKSLMTKLQDYFTGKVDQIAINNKLFEITIPVEYQGLQFITILSLHPAWIFIKCKLMDLEEMGEKVRTELFEKVLTANYELNAVFYSVDPDLQAVWVENDIAVPGLAIESFDINFNAIIFGIKFFIDNIAVPLNQQMKSTFKSSPATSMYT
nr:hypothetical protein [Candidatus Sigynarchaeota archaeon]